MVDRGNTATHHNGRSGVDEDGGSRNHSAGTQLLEEVHWRIQAASSLLRQPQLIDRIPASTQLCPQVEISYITKNLDR
jgi:hypothetical protein